MCKDKKVGRKHSLSLMLEDYAVFHDIYDDFNDIRTLRAEGLRGLAKILADYDVATLEELKERLKK